MRLGGSAGVSAPALVRAIPRAHRGAGAGASDGAHEYERNSRTPGDGKAAISTRLLRTCATFGHRFTTTTSH